MNELSYWDIALSAVFLVLGLVNIYARSRVEDRLSRLEHEVQAYLMFIMALLVLK